MHPDPFLELLLEQLKVNEDDERYDAALRELIKQVVINAKVDKTIILLLLLLLFTLVTTTIPLGDT